MSATSSISSAPSISEVTNKMGVIQFVISNVNISYANALRRVIQSDIPIVVIRGIMDKAYNPSAEHKTINTSPFDNEIMEQRLRCIPISLKHHHTVADFQNWVLVIDVTNNSDTIRTITTEDFQIYDTSSQAYVSRDIVKQLFPPYIAPDGNAYFIELVKLRPRVSERIPGEQLSIRCEFGEGTQKENGCFNVASTIAVNPITDQAASDAARNVHIQACKERNMSESELNSELKNWPLLTGQRYTLADTFQFTIQSIGIYDTKDLLLRACELIEDKFARFVADVSDTSGGDTTIARIVRAPVDVPHCVDVQLLGEDYTMGNILRYELYTHLYPSTLSFVGFKKMHPHDNYSVVRMAYREDASTENSADLGVDMNLVRRNLSEIGNQIRGNITAIKDTIQNAIHH